MGRRERGVGKEGYLRKQSPGREKRREERERVGKG